MTLIELERKGTSLVSDVLSNYKQKSIDHSVRSMSNLTDTFIPHVYVLKNFFNTRMLYLINSFLEEKDLPWQDQPEYNKSGNIVGRQKLEWFPHPVFEEISEILNLVTVQLNTVFKTDTMFKSVHIWKDSEGFEMDKHIDNPIIHYSLQLYLSKNVDKSIGTTFYYNNQEFKMPYEKNCGYLLDNLHPVVHSPSMILPSGVERYSLYAIWTNN